MTVIYVIIFFSLMLQYSLNSVINNKTQEQLHGGGHAKCLTSKTFDHENEGQGHCIQHSQRRDSMANIIIYKHYHCAFLARSHRF